MSRYARAEADERGETIVECEWCDAYFVVDSIDPAEVAQAISERGWSTGFACSRGRGGKGCQRLDLCPSCTPGGAP